jgi:hypothetical protein
MTNPRARVYTWLFLWYHHCAQPTSKTVDTKRSEAAKKAWVLRKIKLRAKAVDERIQDEQKKKKRSEAAKKAWATIRRNKALAAEVTAKKGTQYRSIDDSWESAD